MCRIMPALTLTIIAGLLQNRWAGASIRHDHQYRRTACNIPRASPHLVQQEPNRPAMNVPLAWRILTYDKRRTALALIGIFMAILLVFVELGFFYAVPRGGLLLYDNMRFDLLLISNQYEYQAQPGAFSLSQLERVRSSPDVVEATPIYFGFAKWKSGEGDLWPDVFLIGFDPASHIFTPDSINRQTTALDQADTILVD